MSDLIISVAGIRGIVGRSFTAEAIVPFVTAFADLLEGKGRKQVVVGGDSRESRSWAEPVVEAALRARGVKVIHLGMVPTPTIGMMVRRFRAGGGIAITASHNPSEWNGLKFFQPSGQFLGEDQHARMKKLMERNAKGGRKQGVEGVGDYVERPEAVQLHLEKIRKSLLDDAPGPRRKLKVVLDCCNGAASTLAPLLAVAAGAKPEIIFASPGRPFPRNPEPLPENLRALCREVDRCGADLGAAFDPDADRLALVDETGRAIGEERTLVLATDTYLQMTGSRKPIAVNMSTSQAMEDVAAKYGTRVVRAKVGEAHVVAAMRRARSVIGGEGNGGVIVPSIHPGRDGATALALILLGLRGKRTPLSRWNASIPDYVMIKKKLPIAGLPIPKLMKRARSVYRDAGEIDESDGLKFIYEDSWLQLRPSGTEPILRLFVEAPDQVSAKSLLVRARALLQ